ncbi:MFS transporter [Thaumasiovibrio sp. DFM-14]|uniref:MFS transporter n=1 Tax=Thaumasiovibrio sp. DFM-14 TaxID=3384792 RepID=UPI0039A23379
MTKKSLGYSLALAGILTLALNLRGPFTSVAPLLEQIITSLSLSTASAGIVTGLPLLAFALISPFGANAIKHLGTERSLVLALLFIAGGIGLRSAGAIPTLYLGTLLLGAGIALGNVLLPVVVKTHFPAKISQLTALYTFTMGIGSTLGAGLMVPLSTIQSDIMDGWQIALLFNLLFPVIALSIWIPLLKKSRSASINRQSSHRSTRYLLTNPIAWQVTFALGLNSFTFYSFAGWLPKILNDAGYSEVEAGMLYAALQFATMLPGLVLVPFLARCNKRILVTVIASMNVVAITGLLYFPSLAMVWCVMFGFCNCATFIMALSFVGLRTQTTAQAAALSGMAQSFGYAFAAIGPSLLGLLYSLTNSWTAPLLTVATIAACCAFFSNLSAREQTICDQ